MYTYNVITFLWLPFFYNSPAKVLFLGKNMLSSNKTDPGMNINRLLIIAGNISEQKQLLKGLKSSTSFVLSQKVSA